MLEPIQRRIDHQHHFHYHPASRMDGFMLGQAEPPIRQHTLPFNMQQFLPGNIMNNPQISRGISGFSGVLENIQKVLKVVETTTPLIQEYGPMIKNLPEIFLFQSMHLRERWKVIRLSLKLPNTRKGG